jgi:hypothetical protein
VERHRQDTRLRLDVFQEVEKMEFINPVSAKGGVLRTTRQALRFIENELPTELRSLPRWSFAEKLLANAELSQKRRDLKYAYRQLRQALQNDSLLIEIDPPGNNRDGSPNQIARRVDSQSY